MADSRPKHRCALSCRQAFARLAVAIAAFVPKVLSAAETPNTDFFETRIRPVLVEHCYKCHSTAAGKSEGGLTLDTRAAMRIGGSSGPAVVPSDEEKSLILAAIKHDGLQMPPDRKLPPEVVADFERWIELGAPDPRDGAAAAPKPTVDYAVARKHWAFQPVVPFTPPPIAAADWPRDPLDRFILARLESAGFRPAADAAGPAWLRRVTFILTGLPPTPQEIVDFAADASPRARARVVDRLLASPAFGERWGRHWLDAARYAETNGKTMNLVWPHAFRYRDYVVGAFNRDLPYDQFLREQIAGDLLPAGDDQTRAARIAATGFSAIGAKSYEEGAPREKFLLETADDQIDVVSRAMLGLTVACARCHDHKFDPVPQADYYALAGIFLSSETLCGPGPKHNGYKGYDAPYRPLGAESERLDGPYAAHDALVRQKAAELGSQRSSRYRHVKNKASLENDRKAAAGDAAKAADLDAKIAAEQAKIAEWDAKIALQLKEIERLEKSYPPAPKYAMAMRDAPSPADCALRYRGDWKRPGPAIPRGAPSLGAIAGLPPLEIDPKSSGRLELAGWITDARNPLAPRVAVNRLWHYVFGRGLVTTLDNFGALGDRPSHPELLDYLAGEFVRDGWSTKRLLRRLVLSRTFATAVDDRSPLAAADPENRLFGRRTLYRLEAEAIRDAMLSAAGTLTAPPAEGTLIAQAAVSSANSLESLPADETNRTCRSLYLTMARSAVPEMLTLFDFPDPSLPAARRERRTLPTQALWMMNSPVAVAQARKLAERVLAEPVPAERVPADSSADTPHDPSVEARVERLHQLCFGRSATPAEHRRISEFVAGTSAAKQIDAWSAVCQTLFAAAEFRYLQ